MKLVSDKEHAEMIRLYVEERLNLEKIVEYFSLSSRTHLLPHSEPKSAVERNGFWSACC